MKLHRFFIIFLSLLLITCGMRADGGDVLERIIRLPGTKGTVYSLLSKVSEQSGYLFVYDSKVVNNDVEIKTKKKNTNIFGALILSDFNNRFPSFRKLNSLKTRKTRINRNARITSR